MEITNRMWEKAYNKKLADILETTKNLVIWLIANKLAGRYEDGERSVELYKAIMELN